jgi:hypothetical protein
LFAAFDAIDVGHMQWIVKDLARSIETDALVLALIGNVLGFVPFEDTGCHDNIVVTK